MAAMDFPLRHFESTESFYSDDSDAHNNMTAPAKNPSRPRPRSLLVKAPPKSHRRYQSEEEAPSPVEEEEDYSELSSRSDAEASQDEIDIDPTIDLDALEVLHSGPYETAKRITILCCGMAAEIHIGRPAPRRRGAMTGRSESPIQKIAVPRRSSRRRQRSISLYNPTDDILGCALTSTPTQASFDSSRSSSASRSRSSSAVRSSSTARSSSGTRSVTNFSAPLRNPNRPRPSRLASNQSTSSLDSGAAVPSLSHGPESPAESLQHDEDDDSDAVMRESVEVQVRTRSAERTRQMALSGADTAQYSDEELEATPKMMPPTSYDAYDPYGLEPPQLAGEGRRGSAVANVARKWKGFTRVGRRGRRDATAGMGESGW